MQRLEAVPPDVKEMESAVVIGGATQLFAVDLLRERLVVELKMAAEKVCSREPHGSSW